MKPAKRILVVYYSLSGNTGRVAEDLAARLGAERERIGDLKNRRGFLGYLRAVLDSIRERPAQLGATGKLPSDYALTIIGTPVWAGKMTPAVRAYLRSIHGRCNDVAFFTTSGSTAAERVVPAMERLVDRQAVAFAGFNYGDLNTAALYERKVATFLAALQGERSVPIREEHTHAPA